MLAQQLAVSAETALLELRDEPRVKVAPVEPEEPLALAAHLCALAEEGVAAVLTGGTARSVRLLAAAAARAGVPLLLADSAPKNHTWEVLALYPDNRVLAQACADLCKEKGWKRAVFLHAGEAEVAALIAPDAEPLALVVRHLPPPDDAALLRNLMLVLKKLSVTNFIVWCDAECSLRVLDVAQRVGLLSDRHSYIMLSLDLHTQPLADYSHGGANITALRLFEPQSKDVQHMMTLWERQYGARLGDEASLAGPERSVPTALPLAYQASSLVAKALRALNLPPGASASCQVGLGAFHADTLLNYLRSEEWTSGSGMGGELSWEVDGWRHEVQLQVAELARGGWLEPAGLWAPRVGVTWQRPDEPRNSMPDYSMTNRTFTFLIARIKPYIMRQESTLRLAGNAQYEGFCIELIEKLAAMLKFNYTFVEQEDGEYGIYNNTLGKWTGMLGRLIEDKDIDFAITDLTITSEREKAVDFTTPFMNLGISILFGTPEPAPPKLFAFMLPFSNAVWICLGFAYLGTSLVLYVVGRLCHEEWQNPYPCIEDPPALENQFTLANALWFNLGAVLLQGSEIAPVAYGTRAVASVWWLFALVITSSYTANLATLLASKSSTDLIHNVEELANNNLGIKYGAKKGGSTYNFFKNSQNPTYHKMYEQMSKEPMPLSNEIGIKKVENEKYAFLMESTSIEYETERNCKVQKVGGLLDRKGYGIAMKKDSPYRQELNLALLNLQEAGVLREMMHTWWMEKNGGGACKEDETRENQELRIKNFLGLFVVLVVGCVLGVLVSCCDLAWAARRQRGPSESFWQRFWTELRFVFRFEQSVKPLQGPLIPDSPVSQQSEGAEECRTEREETGSERARAAPRTSSAARRRSSMHAASLRIARHTTRDSTTPH